MFSRTEVKQKPVIQKLNISDKDKSCHLQNYKYVQICEEKMITNFVLSFLVGFLKLQLSLKTYKEEK